MELPQTIIFDFWGTLVDNGIRPSPLQQIKRALFLEDMPFSNFIITLENIFMLKKFKNLKEAFEKVYQGFNKQQDQQRVEDLIGMWNKNWMLASPYSETEEVLKKLKDQGKKLILVSNTDNFSAPEVVKKFKLESYFDQIFYSFEQGKLKGDILKDLVDKGKIKSEQTMMVGDSLESDIKPAEELGLTPVLVDRREKREYKNKIKDLRELFD